MKSIPWCYAVFLLAANSKDIQLASAKPCLTDYDHIVPSNSNEPSTRIYPTITSTTEKVIMEGQEVTSRMPTTRSSHPGSNSITIKDSNECLKLLLPITKLTTDDINNGKFLMGIPDSSSVPTKISESENHPINFTESKEYSKLVYTVTNSTTETIIKDYQFRMRIPKSTVPEEHSIMRSDTPVLPDSQEYSLPVHTNINLTNKTVITDNQLRMRIPRSAVSAKHSISGSDPLVFPDSLSSVPTTESVITNDNLSMVVPSVTVSKRPLNADNDAVFFIDLEEDFHFSSVPPTFKPTTEVTVTNNQLPRDVLTRLSAKPSRALDNPIVVKHVEKSSKLIDQNIERKVDVAIVEPYISSGCVVITDTKPNSKLNCPTVTSTTTEAQIDEDTDKFTMDLPELECPSGNCRVEGECRECF